MLFGRETWRVIKQIDKTYNAFLNKCLRHILKISWPNVITNKEFWKITDQAQTPQEISKRK